MSCFDYAFWQCIILDSGLSNYELSFDKKKVEERFILPNKIYLSYCHIF